jgi:predicted RNA polymerase sigma factor
MSTALALQGYEALASVDGREERKRVAMLAAVCRDIDAAPRKVEAMIEAVKAHPTQLTYGTLRNAY